VTLYPNYQLFPANNSTLQIIGAGLTGAGRSIVSVSLSTGTCNSFAAGPSGFLYQSIYCYFTTNANRPQYPGNMSAVVTINDNGDSTWDYEVVATVVPAPTVFNGQLAASSTYFNVYGFGFGSSSFPCSVQLTTGGTCTPSSVTATRHVAS